MTVSPYLGFGSLRPALDRGRESGSGVFVLALTSNPEGAEVQRSTAADGRPLAQLMLDHMAAENAGADAAGFGRRGGRRHARRRRAWTSPSTARCSAPGIGAQGATPADLPGVFGSAVRDVVPSVSRGVLRHGPDVAALREAAARYADEVRAALLAG